VIYADVVELKRTLDEKTALEPYTRAALAHLPNASELIEIRAALRRRLATGLEPWLKVYGLTR